MNTPASLISPKYADSQLPSSSLDIEIVNNFVIGNGDSFDELIFGIDVHYEKIYYTLYRSYVDFVYLHAQLRKTFPQCEIPSLPLNATSRIQKALKKENNSTQTRTMSKSQLIRNSSRNSVSAISKHSFSDLSVTSEKSVVPQMKASDKSENMDQKVKELQLYIRAILTFHEIIVSDIFAEFLDEEIASPALDAPVKEASTEQDLLLLNTPSSTVSVRNKDVVSFDVTAGQLVIWRFETANYDIGFTVELDDEVVVSYTRYRANEITVRGTLEVPRQGICKLIWDNSYAKCNLLKQQF